MSYLVVSYEIKQSSPELISSLNAQLVARGFQKSSSGGETSLYRECGVGVASESFLEQTQRIFDDVIRGMGGLLYELTIVPSEKADAPIYKTRNFPF